MAGLPHHPVRVPSTSLEGRNTTVTPTKLPTDNRLRVFRGGGWINTDPSKFRSALRFRLTPADRDDLLGFRCAQRGAKMPVGKVGP